MPSPGTHRSQPGRGSDERGVTLYELLIVMVIMSVLAGIAFNNFGEQREAMAVRSAENAFLSLHSVARGAAVERGEVVRLRVDSEEDRVSVLILDDTIRTTDFQDAFDASVEGDLELCMTPRGFADDSCMESTTDVTFSRGSSSGGVVVEPLGQAERK